MENRRELTEYERQLHLAAKCNEIEKVKELLDMGISPNCPSRHGTTPLSFAASRGHAEIVELLLDFGASVQPLSRSRVDNTPIFLAAQYNRHQVLELLCEAGSPVNLHRMDGNTPLQMAILSGNTQAVRVLLKAGADHSKVGSRSSPPLYRAAMLGHFEIVRMLIEYGAPVEVVSTLRDPELGIVPGYTPLIAAARRGHTDVCRLLLAAGANPEVLIPVNDNFRRSLPPQPAIYHLAKEANSVIHCKGFKTLLFEGGLRDLRGVEDALRTLTTIPPPTHNPQIPGVIVTIIEEGLLARIAQQKLVPRLLHHLDRERMLPPPICEMIVGCDRSNSFLVYRNVWVGHRSLTDLRRARITLAEEKFDHDALALCGRRIKVKWNSGRSAYRGMIVSFDRTSRRHTVKYEDGDVREYDLDGLIMKSSAGRFELL